VIVLIIGKVSYHKEDREEYPTSYKEGTETDDCVSCNFRSDEDRNRKPKVLRFILFLVNSLMKNSGQKKESTSSP